MGTIWYVGCKDCKSYRDLDKLSYNNPTTRNDALKLSDEGDDSFRWVLLTGFMLKHHAHNCILFSEHEDDLCNEFEIYTNPDKLQDVNFWEKT
jgi:hypothetical protein